MACGVKSTWPIFKTKILICQSKVNLDGKIFFGTMTHHVDPEIRKIMMSGLYEDEKSTFHSSP